MWLKKHSLIVLLITLFMPFTALAGSDLWFHVSVDEADGATVRVNLPIGMMETALSMIDEDEFHDGHINIDGEDIDTADLRKMWEELKNSPEGINYITVHDHDEDVKISRQGGYLIVDVSNSSDGEQVDVRLPEAVVDALFSGDQGTLNIAAAMQVLAEDHHGELVTIKSSDGDNVRVWVDSTPEAR